MGEVQLIGDMTECEAFLSQNRLAVIDFYADWCGPCKAIAPKVLTMAKEYTMVKFGKVNVDDAEEVAAKYSVSAMPTFIFFENGKKTESVVGASEAKLREQLEKLKGL